MRFNYLAILMLIGITSSAIAMDYVASPINDTKGILFRWQAMVPAKQSNQTKINIKLLFLM